MAKRKLTSFDRELISFDRDYQYEFFGKFPDEGPLRGTPSDQLNPYFEWNCEGRVNEEKCLLDAKIEAEKIKKYFDDVFDKERGLYFDSEVMVDEGEMNVFLDFELRPELPNGSWPPKADDLAKKFQNLMDELKIGW